MLVQLACTFWLCFDTIQVNSLYLTGSLTLGTPLSSLWYKACVLSPQSFPSNQNEQRGLFWSLPTAACLYPGWAFALSQLPYWFCPNIPYTATHCSTLDFMFQDTMSQVWQMKIDNQNLWRNPVVYPILGTFLLWRASDAC